MQYYEAIGIEPRLTLDPDDLKKRFYEQSRTWHPDRFSRASADDQQKALDMTAALNDAFRTLRDPVSRAEYFLSEKGIEPSKTPPTELLEEMFEMNMILEELREGDASARPQLAETRARFVEMQNRIDADVASRASGYDAAPDSAKLDELRGILDRRRYVSNLLRDVDKALVVPA